MIEMQEEPMPNGEPITGWVRQLQSGDAGAAQKLWEGYFDRLVRLARGKLQGTPRRAADEEDVALSAFDSFCRGAARGRFPQLQDRDDLWQLLIVITERKAFDLAQHSRRRKRDWRREHHSVETNGDSSADVLPGANLVGREPDPEFAAEMVEECRRLLGLLGDKDLRSIALWKMEGYTNLEVGAQLGFAVATVERRLQLIRKIWQSEIPT
jgi:DNA-directed RNA polymerase specialized sigma24 family protein